MAALQRLARLACVLGMLIGSPVSARLAALPQTSVTFSQTEPRDDWRDRSDAYAALTRLAAREPDDRGSPPTLEVRGVALPEVSVLVETDPGWTDAQRTLEDTLDRLHAPSPEWAVPPPPPVTPAVEVRAQRLYVSGLAKRTAGDNEGAVKDLTAAARLDPGASAPWLRLAEAQARTGQGAASLLSRRRAADLGDNNPVSLYILGTHTARLGQHDLAAHYLARCVRERTNRIDPLLRPLALVRLGETLQELGLLRASIEAMQTGLGEMPAVPVRSPLSREAAEVIASATDYWLAVGDAAIRLGEDQIAADAYAEAEAHAAEGSNAMFLRRAAVFLRSGQAAALAALVLDEATAHGGFINSVQRQLLASLRGNDTVASQTAAALQDLANSFPVDSPESIHTSLLLARAAVLPAADAKSLLLGEGLPYLDDPRLLDAIFVSTEEHRRTDLALEILAIQPRLARPVAAAVERWHAAPGTLIGALDQTPSARLLRAELQTAAGDAVAVAESPLDTEPATAARLEVQGRAAALAGAWDTVDQTVVALDDHPIEQARVLFTAQRFKEGFDRLVPELGESASPRTLLMGAELAFAGGAPERAEALFGRAIGLDPFSQSAYEGLINVYQHYGDSRRAAEALRLLRDRLPEAWYAKWIQAQEQTRSGMIDQAESTLRALIETAPDRAAPIDLLSQLWAQRAARGESDALSGAQQWVEKQTDTLPSSASLWALRGRLLTLRGADDQAERVLRDAFKAHPSVVLSRAMERLLRETGREEEADRLALERYRRAGRGIEASLDYAESLARGQRWAEITPVLRFAMPERATLTPRQHARTIAIISALAARADGQVSTTERQNLLGVLNLAAERGLALPWQLLSLRWTLLSTDKTTDNDTIVAAARDFLDAIDSPDAARSMASRATMTVPSPIQTLDQGRGSVAYLLANSLQSDGRVPAALAMFRLALEYYPDHAWAANDLGYLLVERHESLDEAERLLEHAYELMPAQASIADSLAWLRYKTDRLQDQHQADGTLMPGAESLLKSAIGLPGGEANPTIHDHLGDTLWRLGDQERALAAWVRAQQLLIGRLTRLRDGGSSPARDRLTEQVSRVGAKVDAVRAGQEPQITLLFENSPADH